MSLHRELYNTDFNQGLGGWTGLKSGSLTATTAANLYKWPTLTTEASAYGGKSLKLDAGKGTNNTCWAIKRMALERGELRWSGHVAVNGTHENWLRFLRFAWDTQDPQWSAGSKRFWFEVRYVAFDESAVAYAGDWQVEVGTVGGSSMTTFETGHILPYNEWQKQNFHRFAMTINTTTMSYVSFQIDSTVFPLTQYAPTADTPLSGVVFDGGLNTMMAVQNRSNNSEAWSWAYLDKPRLERLATGVLTE